MTIAFQKSYRYEFIEILWARILSLNKWIKRFAAISIIVILLIEFGLNKIPAYSEFMYDFGVIILKLSYSFFSAFIFYFLVVHLPKEKRKANSYRILQNSITSLYNNLYLLLVSALKIEDSDNLTLEQFLKVCELTD